MRPGAPDLIVLRQHAETVHAAIEAVPPAERPEGMRRFPAGGCGDASLLLGAYLADRGIKGFEYVCAARGDKREDTWTSHAWLQLRECIIDITAGQFEDAPAAIVVADSSPWHLTFRVDRFYPADFRVWSGPGMLRVMYGRILARIEGHA